MSDELDLVISENQEFKDNLLVEKQDEIINALVKTWNSIITDFENKTIIFALRVKDLMKGYPEKTRSEVIRKMREHPDLQQPMHSQARIEQGIRFVEERPDIIRFMNLPIEERKKIPWEERPYCKRDLSVNMEFYYLIHKWNMDPGIRFMLEDKAKREVWSTRKTKEEIEKIIDEKREPNTRRRMLKSKLIREISGMLKNLSVEDLQDIQKEVLFKCETKLGCKK